MDIYLNNQTKKSLATYDSNPPQALLLVGAKGVGLKAIAIKLAKQNLVNIITPTDIKGDIDPTSKGVIRLEQIRQMQGDVRSKTNKPRVFIIDDADKMNTSSQNAFLKTLEEPNSNIYFILTSHNPNILLPTIKSRVHKLLIKPISELDSINLITNLGVTEAHKKNQLLFLALGKPAELTRLANNNEYFKQRANILNDARLFINGKKTEKAEIIVKYGKDRAMALDLLTACKTIVMFTNNKQSAVELIRLADRLLITYNNIRLNGNPRLQLTGFMLQ